MGTRGKKEGGFGIFISCFEYLAWNLRSWGEFRGVVFLLKKRAASGERRAGKRKKEGGFVVIFWAC